MIPAEIVLRISRHCNRRHLLVARLVCCEWFWIMDAQLDSHRWEYTLKRRYIHHAVFKIDFISSVCALNYTEACMAFLQNITDPTWCDYIWRLRLSITRPGRGSARNYSHDIQYFRLNPLAFSRKLRKLVDAGWGLCIKREIILDYPIQLPRGSWRPASGLN